jgi:Zn-dependent protease
VNDTGLILRFALVLPMLLVSFAVHELAHAYVATRLGDPTAREEGRLTLNPLRHLDLWGTVVLVVTFVGSGGSFLFGWAKPVTTNPSYFRDAQRGMMLVGAAGPLANIAAALVSAALVWLTVGLSVFVAQALALAYLLNVLLAVFNLLPIPPLDGSRVVGGVLPRSVYPRWVALDRYGNYVFLALIAVLLLAPEVFDATIGAVLVWSFALLPGGGG